MTRNLIYILWIVCTINMAISAKKEVVVLQFRLWCDRKKRNLLLSLTVKYVCQLKCQHVGCDLMQLVFWWTSMILLRCCITFYILATYGLAICFYVTASMLLWSDSQSHHWSLYSCHADITVPQSLPQVLALHVFFVLHNGRETAEFQHGVLRKIKHDIVLTAGCCASSVRAVSQCPCLCVRQKPAFY